MNADQVPRPLRSLLTEFDAITAACRATERANAQRLSQLPAKAAASAANLLHYLVFRSRDRRELQHALQGIGLSSLGRCEAHVLPSLANVRFVLGVLAGEGAVRPPVPEERLASMASVTFGHAGVLEARATDLLGLPRGGQSTRVMVTLPTQAADDAGLLDALIAAGMTVARINTAHDGPVRWTRMAEGVRSSAKRLGLECRVLIDLAGPKLRTGPFEPGAQVVCISPRRDELGNVTVPAQAVLAPPEFPADLHPALPVIPVSTDWCSALAAGDHITLRDARGRRRLLHVVQRIESSAWLVRTDRTAYIASGLELTRLSASAPPTSAHVGALPAVERFAAVHIGDRIVLRTGAGPGQTRPGDAPDSAPTITCEARDVLSHVRVGERVLFDDGKVCCVVRSRTGDRLDLQVTIAASEGDKVRADRGINLPDTDIRYTGLTSDDTEVLPLACSCADIISLSFVQQAEDIRDLRRRIAALGRPDMPIIAKIETRRAFDHLPDILLELLCSPAAGVMIARGDLAVECGFERLAEVQEEILWLAEAAHLPVIWATQVLESLAKRGRPSRAEISDAAMSGRAECVMLNKGPNILRAMRALDDVLRRMSSHQHKKRSMLRALAVAQRFLVDSDPQAGVPW